MLKPCGLEALLMKKNVAFKRPKPSCREAAEVFSRASSPAREKIMLLCVLCASSEAGGNNKHHYSNLCYLYQNEYELASSLARQRFSLSAFMHSCRKASYPQ